MADAAATLPAPGTFSLPTSALQAGLLSKRRDIFFAVGIICILIVR